MSSGTQREWPQSCLNGYNPPKAGIAFHMKTSANPANPEDDWLLQSQVFSAVTILRTWKIAARSGVRAQQENGFSNSKVKEHRS
jgi:hypothetical protein